MKTVKLGTIGSGNIVHTILDCVLRTPDIQLEAVYSRTQEKGESLAKQYGTGKVYTDLEAFLRSTRSISPRPIFCTMNRPKRRFWRAST